MKTLGIAAALALEPGDARAPLGDRKDVADEHREELAQRDAGTRVSNALPVAEPAGDLGGALALADKSARPEGLPLAGPRVRDANALP